MSYIGGNPSKTLASPTSQYFNGDGSTVTFTLNRPVNVAEDLEVFVNNIQQEPGVGKSYTATGTTLTFDAAPSAGTANVYVVYRGLAEVTTRLEHDPNAALAATTGTFSGDLTVDTNTLYVDSTNNRVGVGTTSPAYNLDVYNLASSGAPLLARFKSAGGDTQLYVDNSTITTQLTADSANSAGIVGTKTNHPFVFRTNNIEQMRIDTSGRITMPYQPFFSAYKNGNQSLSAHTPTKITSWSVLYNVGSGWDAANNRWTAPTAGYYLIHVCAQSNVLGGLHVRLDVNGSNGWNGDSYLDGGDVTGLNNTYFANLSANDYVDFYCYITSAGTITANRTRFSVVKLA